MAEFLDARDGAIPDGVATDVCIVGAGAAGITVALHLGASERILLLESGGLLPEDSTQSLYAGKQLGLQYADLASCRLRYFGGTTNHWAGYCRPNDPIDYEGRPDLDVPRWPLDGGDLEPFVRRAAEQLGLVSEGFDPQHQLRIRNLPRNALLDDASTSLKTKVFQVTERLRFSKLYRERLKAKRNLRVLLHANVTHVQLDRNGREVRGLTVRTTSGRSLTVTASRYVLACHAIEIARLLLASRDVVHQGIGNESGHVGRYFMDHPAVMSGLFIPHRRRFPFFYNAEYMLTQNVNPNLSISEDGMRKAEMLQYYCRFWPVYDAEETRLAVRRLSDGFWKPADVRFLRSMGEVIADLPGAVSIAYERITGQPAEPIAYKLDQRIEQAPNRECRVVLSEARDELGSPRADLHWALRELDYRTFQRGQEIVAREVSRLGLGRFQLENLDRELIDARVAGRFHQIGTTRMSTHPRDGVVNADCRVHGVANLYVAGSSVFPTAGYSGPTMMLMALGLRLASHLKALT